MKVNFSLNVNLSNSLR